MNRLALAAVAEQHAVLGIQRGGFPYGQYMEIDIPPIRDCTSKPYEQ